MKHHTLIVTGIVILIGAIFVAIYVSAPKKVTAPEVSSGTPVASSTPTGQQGAAVTAVVSSIKETASSSPIVTVEYPQFPALPADFNSTISSSVMSQLADFRSTVADNEKARLATAQHGDASIPLSAYSFDVSWQPVQVNSRYVSFIMRYDEYSGGANGDQELETYNYDVSAHKAMTLADLFPNSPDYLKQISVLARTQLTASMDQASDGNVPTDMLAAGTEPTADNFQYFTFTDNAVTIYFPKYAVAPGSFGEQKVVISRSAIK